MGECYFIEREINFDKSLHILDVGCGTGRHSIELSKRGYQITGVDLSQSMLNRAVSKAKAQGVSIDFRRADARNLPFDNVFDVAIMICEGAFPLMETDEMNYEILKSVARALRTGGKFIFTTLNGLFALYNSVEKFCGQASVEGNAKYHGNSFDLMTFRDHNTTEIKDDDGKHRSLCCNERYYVPSEITWLLKSAGFTNIEIFGAKLGAFSRDDPLTPKDFEMLVLARKEG